MKILIEESVLRQALDELCTQRDAHYSGDYPIELRESITALRTALDAAEADECQPEDCDCVGFHTGACRKVEPVAWYGVTGDYGFPFLSFQEQPGMTPLYSAPAVQEGWQLVPKEPTSEMVLEGENLMNLVTSRGIYKSMLSAAPTSPKTGEIT